MSPTDNRHGAIAAVMLASSEAEELLGRSLLEDITDPATGEIQTSAATTSPTELTWPENQRPVKNPAAGAGFRVWG